MPDRLVVALLMFLPSTGLAQSAPSLVSAPDGSVRLSPDPTVLTTQAQEKSIAALRELVDARVAAILEEIRQFKDTLDRTDLRLIKRIDDMPGENGKQIAHLQELMNEKFKGVDQQFQGRDTALAAALLAQKTSVTDQQTANALSASKAEAAVTKQIDGISGVIAANSNGTNDKVEGIRVLLANQDKFTQSQIAEIRGSLSDLRTAITARGAGQSDLWGWLIAGALAVVALLGFLLPRLPVRQAYYLPPHDDPRPRP